MYYPVVLKDYSHWLGFKRNFDPFDRKPGNHNLLLFLFGSYQDMRTFNY